MFFFKKREKSLQERLSETKKVKVKGILFELKRINPMNHLEGSEVLVKTFDVYKVNKNETEATDMVKKNQSKIFKHWGDVILAGVVSPKIVRKKDDVHTCIDDVLSDYDLAQDLYFEIMHFTYGKKKVISRS